MERLYCDGCGRELAPANAYPGDENGGPYCTACELKRPVMTAAEWAAQEERDAAEDMVRFEREHRFREDEPPLDPEEAGGF